MSAALVQHLGAIAFGTASTTTVLTVSKTVTVGNRIIVVCGLWTGSVSGSSAVDNLGNSYALDAYNQPPVINKSAVLLSAPVTTGGSLTTITVTHTSCTWRAISAAEFSGVGTFASDGAATSSNAGTTAIWDNNKTIPANGLAVGGNFTGNIGTTHSAGAASGSPSTQSVMDNWTGNASYLSSSFHHALPGVTDVTAYTGTATFASDSYCAVGGNYNPATGGGGGGLFLMLEDGSGAYELEDASGGILLEA
jgi:hypothetical protein